MSRPGQPQVDIRADKWDKVNGDPPQMGDPCVLWCVICEQFEFWVIIRFWGINHNSFNIFLFNS